VRIDDFLSTVFLIKRRTQAKEWVTAGKVLLNGHPAKPAHPVKPGDKIEIHYQGRAVTATILAIPEKSVSHREAAQYYQLSESNRRDEREQI